MRQAVQVAGLYSVLRSNLPIFILNYEYQRISKRTFEIIDIGTCRVNRVDLLDKFPSTTTVEYVRRSNW